MGPKIAPYTENVQAPRSTGRIPQTEAVHIGAGKDRALESVSRGLGQMMAVLAEREEADARAWSANQISQTRVTWTEQLLERQQKAQPGAPEFTTVLLEDFDKYADQQIGAAPNERSKVFLTQRLADFRADMASKSLVFEAGARVDHRVDQYKSAAQNVARTMNTDPSQYAPALAEQLAIIDASDLPPLKRSEIREFVTNHVSKAAVAAQIQKSPSLFLASIGFGVPDKGQPGDRTRTSTGTLTGKTGNIAFDVLPFEMRTQLFEQAIRLKAQVDADADRLTVLRGKQVSDEASKDLWTSWARGTLSLDAILARRSDLSEPDFKSLVQANAQGAVERRDDPGTVGSLMDMMSKDPEGARQFAMTAHRNGLLSTSTMRAEVTRADSFIRDRGPKSQFERSRSYIATTLNPGDNTYDPVARARLGNALAEFDQWRVDNPKADDKSTRERGLEVIEQYRFLNLSEAVFALPFPRGTKLTRTTNMDVLRLDVAKAYETLVRNQASGKISRDEFDRENQTLNRWRRLLPGQDAK